MVLTYQEAVIATAKLIRRVRFPYAPPVPTLAAFDTADAVLEAVGYADLLAEVERLRGSADAWWTEYDVARAEAENLRITVREDKRVMDRDAVEIKRLRLLASRWEEIVSAPSFDAAVNAAAQSYHETECVYRTERDRLRQGVDDAIPYLGERELAEPILRSLLAETAYPQPGRDQEQPGNNDASLQWVLDCDLGPAVPTEGGA